MMTPPECYLTSVDRLWKKELTQAAAKAVKVIICSPYLTSQTADTIISCVPAEHCEIYTRFSVEDFAAGSSSLRTLKNLLKKGYKFFSIDRLHAKIIIVSGYFISVGSQNLTAQGTRNREATAISRSPDVVEQVEALLKPWIAQRREITLDMVTDLESGLPQLVRQFRTIREAALQAELQVRQREEQRTAQKLREEQLRLEAIQQRQAQISTARTILHELLPNGRVSKELAQEFVRKSTWWYEYPKAKRPVPAPKHSLNIYEMDGEWQIDFGRNTFLVSKAIKRCIIVIKEYIKSFEEGHPWSREELIRCLHLQVRGSVAIYGKEYKGFYNHMVGNDMKFGVTSIDVNDFTNLILSRISQALLPVE